MCHALRLTCAGLFTAGVVFWALCRYADGASERPIPRLDRYNVVWTSPSSGPSGSMPIGNGDIGLNVWVEQGGDLLFLISKTDAWDAHCRLLKLGRVRIRLEPNPFVPGKPFRQELRLRQGDIQIAAGDDGEEIAVEIRVDANRPAIEVEARGERAFAIEACLEVWRKEETELTGRERDSARGVLGAPYRLVVPADRVFDEEGRIVWCHRNRESCWPITLEVQGLGALKDKYVDPLLGRTFGGAMEGRGLGKTSLTTLRSPKSGTRFGLSIHALTVTEATEEMWRAALERTIASTKADDPSLRRNAHQAWWAEFWDRSWICLDGNIAGGHITTNTLPLRIGAGSTGENPFNGDIDRVRIFRRALRPEEIAALAAQVSEASRKEQGLVGDWTFEELVDGAFPNRASSNLAARVVGNVEVVDAPGGKAIRLAGKGYLEVTHDAKLDFKNAVTIAARVRPASPFTVDGRLVDKSQAGTANGYNLDTYPRNSLRMIVQPNTLIRKSCLRAGVWTHVAATFEAAGDQALYVDGRPVATQRMGTTLDAVAQGYALQRFINACGGRGAGAIKFNGSIFTVDGPDYGPDYRRWGGCYWWQNTRFPYWPMVACGDFDLMEPLFRMYRTILPLRRETTKIYYDHAGAFFVETMYFWGTPCNDDFGWKRNGHPASLMLNKYIRREWQGGLELTMMMLDRYDFTLDEDFVRNTLVPIGDAVLTFYAHHYPREDDGTLRIEPAQALETWWRAVNPMPEVAGLRAVLPRMLSLPESMTTSEQRASWKKLLDALPDLPLRDIEGKMALSAADSFGNRHNAENPELYAIFPYRLRGLGLAGIEEARLAFERRMVKGSRGWQQDPVQSAMLGLTEETARFVTQRFTTSHPGSRFPAFWGPNFDWLPDQCHGGNGMLGLQAMLLQPVGRKLLILPAWPETWDVHFKLHAPFRTTVECEFRDGAIKHLKVSPPERAKDIVRTERRP